MSRRKIEWLLIFLLRTEKNHAEIAEFLNIKMSSFRVRRGRLKKKMNIEGTVHHFV